MNSRRRQIYTELLVIRSQRADTQAFELLVELWHRPLLGFAFNYLGRDCLAQDAVQETWMAAVKGLNKLEKPSMFVPWIFRILANKCIDQLRKKQAQEKLLKDAAPSGHPPVKDGENEELSRAIGRLTNEQRTLICLRFEQGLETGQIAQIFGIAETTVRTRLHRTLNRLREILENKK